jgi:hypothetical protein
LYTTFHRHFDKWKESARAIILQYHMHTIHSQLVQLFSMPGDNQEVNIDGYIIDIVNDKSLIEIQTGNFIAIRHKIRALLGKYSLKLVHPIAREKWIIYIDPINGLPLYRRKSPRFGHLEHLFIELVRIPDVVNHPNFCLEILMTQEEEIRMADGKGSWKRKGISIVDRRLIDVFERKIFSSADDYRIFLSPSLLEPFSSMDISQLRHINIHLARKMTYCLRKIGLINKINCQNRPFRYTIFSRSKDNIG